MRVYVCAAPDRSPQAEVPTEEMVTSLLNSQAGDVLIRWLEHRMGELLVAHYASPNERVTGKIDFVNELFDLRNKSYEHYSSTNRTRAPRRT